MGYYYAIFLFFFLFFFFFFISRWCDVIAMYSTVFMYCVVNWMIMLATHFNIENRIYSLMWCHLFRYFFFFWNSILFRISRILPHRSRRITTASLPASFQFNCWRNNSFFILYSLEIAVCIIIIQTYNIVMACASEWTRFALFSKGEI